MLAHRKYNCSVSVLTPQGRGAIASLQVAGREARNAIESFLIPPALSPLWIAGRHVLRKWHISPECFEDVVLWCQTDQLCEVHCHGGVAVVETLVSQLRSAGAVPVAWMDACASRYAHHELEAIELLPRAHSRQMATRLLEQVDGALSREIDEWRKLVKQEKFGPAIERIQSVLRFRKAAAHLTVPWQVVVAGQPNVGKSSLINQFVGYERSIVFDEPGTTRDVLRASRMLGGWEVEFVDTAGIRDSEDPLEMAGCAFGRVAWQKADLRVVVFEAAEGDMRRSVLSKEDRFPYGSEYSSADLVLMNKVDLLSDRASLIADVSTRRLLSVSARTGEGCEEALEKILSLLVPDTISDGQPLLVTARQAELSADLLNAVQAHDRELALQSLVAFGRPDSEQSFGTSD